MVRVALLSSLLLAGCTSHSLRSDYYETQFRAQQALEGKPAAFDRLAALQSDWRARAEDPAWCRLVPGSEKRVARAAVIADKAERMVRARESVLSQRETTEVMLNAFVDLESEYDSLVDLLVGSEAPVAAVSAITEQKYLIRRMANSLVLMMQVDMSNAVEAADLFGRDVARFQNLLDASINGNEELGIDQPEDPQVEDALAQIEELFTGYVADSAPDMLDNVAYRHDAWLALKEMDELGDGRKGKKVASEKVQTPDSEAKGDATRAEASETDADAAAEGDAGVESDAGAAEEGDGAGDAADAAGMEELVDEPAADGMTEADVPEDAMPSDVEDDGAAADDAPPADEADEDEATM